MILGIDFDGTIVEHRYPEIGPPVPHALQSLKTLSKLGAQLILFTMRSGKELDEAVAYCREGGVEFWGVNTNPDQKSWTDSPKAYCHRYIDDAAVGCPLIIPPEIGKSAYVDWIRVMLHLLSCFPTVRRQVRKGINCKRCMTAEVVDVFRNLCTPCSEHLNKIVEQLRDELDLEYGFGDYVATDKDAAQRLNDLYRSFY